MSSITLVGFDDEARLVQAYARLKEREYFLVHASAYRAGELFLDGPSAPAAAVLVVANIHEDPQFLFRILLLARALREAGAKTVTLLAPWIAYGRQDHVTRPGEACAGLVAAELLGRAYDRIVTLDAHSPRFMEAFGKDRLINVCPLPSSELLRACGEPDLLIAADQGAERRTRACAEGLGLPFVVLKKQREPGRVTITLSPEDAQRVRDQRALIIDDISDSGGTLVTAANVLREAGVVSVSSLVSHTAEVKALRKKIAGAVDHFETLFDHASSKLDISALNALSRAVETVV